MNVVELGEAKAGVLCDQAVPQVDHGGLPTGQCPHVVRVGEQELLDLVQLVADVFAQDVVECCG